MKRILFFFSAILLLSTGSANAQGSNCASATPFCGSSSFPNNTSTTSQSGPSYGCLLTQPNPAWFFIKTTAAGSMVYNISQVNGSGTGIDVDFIAWGPFSSMANACTSLTGSCTTNHACSGNIEDCGYSAAAVETMTLNSPGPGQYYVILITNYADVSGTITFNQTSGPPSDCSVTCPSVTSGNGFNLTNGNPVPATVACSTAPFGLIASGNAPFGNPITPGIMISFTSNANNTLQINWYENGSFILCDGPVANGCGLQIPTNTDNDVQFSTMSPSATNGIEFCETSTTGADIPVTITDVSSGTVLYSGTWTTNAACTTITLPPGSISGVSSWTITPACPGCMTTTDWGYATFNPGVAAAGTYNICYSFDPPGACPTYTYCQNITVTNPNNPAWTAPAPMCSTAGSINLNTLVTGTAGGTWSGPGVTGSTFNPATAGTGGTVTYTVGSGTCSATQSHNITVTPAPTNANAGPDQTVCATTATLAGNTATTGTGVWTLVSGSGSITTPGSPTSGVTGLGVGANVFQWTISNPPCASSSDQVTITRTASPTVANAGPDQTVCATTATLAGNTATTGTGTWTLISGSGSITTPSSPTSGLTGLGVGANVFQWTITNAPCPATNDQVTITRTAPPTTANAGPDQAVCGNSATLAGNGVITGVGTWTLISGSGTITTPSSPTSTVTGLGAGANVFQWNITNAPCPASTDQVTITSTTTPTVANAGPDQTVCAATATLAGNAAVSGTGTWTLISGAGTITTPGSPTSGVTALGVGANVFQWTISNAPCTASSDQVTITRTASPTVANAGPDQTLCATTATLAGNTATTGTGVWTLISGSGTITSPTSPNSGVTGLGAGANVFQWTISNAPCPATSDQVTINSVTPPTVANAGPDQSVCATTATLAGNTATTGSGTWTLISGAGTITTPGSPTSGVTGLGVGANVFQWTITNAPCPATSDQVTITRTASPTVSNAGPDQTTCATTATLAGNAPAVGTGVWTLISGSGTITSPTSPTSGITGLGVGANVFQWTISNAPCPASTDQVTINHPAPGNPAFTYSSSTYCQTGSDPAATITGTAGGTFSSTPAGLVILNASTGLIDVSASALGTYSVTYNTGGACPATSSVNITITSSPAATFSYAGPYCQFGANPSPTFSGGGSAGTFTSTAGLVFVNVNTGQINLSTSTPGTYTVTNSIAASGGCAAATATASVTINPAPAVTATPSSQTICSGTPTNIALTSSLGGTTYSWTVVQSGVSGGAAGAGTPIAQTLSTTGASAGTATYTINSLSGGCAGTPITVPITVNPVPTVTPSPASQTICSGTATGITLSGSLPGTTFNWAAPTQTAASGGASGSGASIIQTLTASGASAGTVTYSVIPTANSCPGSPVSIVVTVNPSPNVVATPSSASICSGATTAINLTSTTAGTTFTWVANNGAGISGATSGTGTSIAQTLNNATGSPGTATYTITPSAAGCTGSPIVVTITVNPVPSAAATPSSQTICSGSTTSVSLTGSIAGTTFTWPAPTQTAASGGAAGSGATIAQTLLATGTSAGTVVYNITPTAGGCPGTPIPVSITVNPVPFATATPASSTICSGATTAVSLSSFTAGTTFSWTASNGTGIAGATSGSGNSIAQVLANSGTATNPATYTVTPTAAGCPGAPVTVTVNVNPVPNVISTPASQTICSGSTTSLALSSSVTGTTFAWSAPTQTGASGGSAGGGSTIAETLTASGTSTGTVMYTVTPTANGCPGNPITINVSVEPNPTAVATPSSAAICSGTSTSISLSSNIPGTTFSWTVTSSGASGESAGSGNTISQVLNASGTTAGTVTYNVTATTPAGCTSTIPPIVITVNPSPDVNATPTNATICSGTSTGIVLTSNVSGTTFSWTQTSTGVTGASAGSGSTITQTLSASGSTPGTVVYTITPSASGCATASPVSVTITVNPLPTATATPSSQTICNGSSTSLNLTSNLGATTFDWTVTQTNVSGASAGSGTSISQLLNLVSTASAGTAVYTVTPTDNGCAGTPVSITVDVNPVDNASFSYASSTYCQTGTDPSATITGTPGGVFSSVPAGLVIDPATGLIDLSASTLGTYTLTYQTNGPCPNNSTVTLTITNAPSASFTYTASVCSSDPNPVPTFGAGASAGTFTSSPAGLVFVDATTGEVDLTNSLAGTYTITNSIAAGGGCAAATATGTIDISQAATVNAGLNDTICAVGTLALNGTIGGSATSVTWTTNGTGTFDNAASLTAVYTPSAADVSAGTVVLTATTNDPAGACSAVSDFVVLTINPQDAATFSYSGSTFCQSGTNPVPVITGTPGGTFSSSAGLSFVDPLTGEISLSGSILGTYNVVYTTNGPCPSTDSATITITTAPVATFTLTSGATSFCQSDPNPTPVFGSGASAGTFTANPSTGLVFVSAATGQVDLLNSTPGVYTLYNNIVAAGGCAAAVDSLTITINQPATVNAGGNATICSGTTYTVSGASIGGSAGSATWTSNGSGTFDDNTLLNATYTPSIADTTAGSVTLYLTTDDPAGVCGAVKDSVILTITPLPAAPAVTNPAPYCMGASVGSITYAGSGGSVNWYSDAALTTNIGTGNPFTPTGISSTTTIYVTETLGSCTSFSSAVTITFNPLPVADSTNSVVTGATCGAATGSITNVVVVSGQNPFTYLWQDGSGNNVGDSLNLTNVGPGVYTLTVTDANGCSTQIGGGTGFTVNSSSGVTASFSADPVTGEEPLPVNFTNTTVGGTSWLWLFPDGSTDTTTNANFTFTQLGSQTVCLTAFNNAGCQDTACATIDVFINSVFVIPNVFTPNGDDINDVFTVKNVGLEKLDAEIYNRWGQKEYEWHTTNGGWDGRTAAGMLVPDGTYFFIISAKGIDGKEYFEKGSFELIR